MNKPIKQVDVFIFGAGIAGLTAGLYAARMKLNTFILEDELVGGQIREAYVVENYPGFMAVNGNELITTVRQQAEAAGAHVDEFDRAVRVSLTDQEKIIETETTVYQAKAVIIAAGNKRRALPVAEEAQFHGRGIHYCELCDGPLYEGKKLAVVGGGNSAVGAAEFLARYAKKVYLVHRSAKLTAEALAQSRLRALPNVEVLLNTQIVKVNGESQIASVTLAETAAAATRELNVDGIFVNIGAVPRTELFAGAIQLSESGHIKAGETCETNVAGVYAAGDVRTKQIRQLTTAAADGTVAALLAEKYIVTQQEQLQEVIGL